MRTAGLKRKLKDPQPAIFDDGFGFIHYHEGYNGFSLLKIGSDGGIPN